MTPTVRSIAQSAGVSPATVSLVLNDKPGVGEETRILVRKIARDQGYQLPKSTSSAKGSTIRLVKVTKHGHILNRDHNAFISDYIDGLDREARLNGYTLEVQSVEGLDLEHLKEDLEQSSLSGALVLATELSPEDILSFQNIRLPLVFLDGTHPDAPFDFVDMDNEGAVFSVIRALVEGGHRRIGLVKSSVETRNFRAREASYYDALSAYGLEINQNWIYEVDSNYEKAGLDMEQYLRRGQSLPTALFCVCDIIAMGCMKAIQKVGMKVPEDLSIVGFDDLPSSQRTDPPLSSVKVCKERIGRRAFQLLKRRIDDAALPYEKVYIGTELVLRESQSFQSE
ncbi:LacI family transcriptional regulator [Oceanispirochaeta crateris]|uniref:LacI family transcriptional regulator n=1 Tax=Oceanispirochaeta crateris TaxID=2518645 RepID=A0A5C1QPJ3_9SPIO|nr:LacI family DNA-binding transcriptional regulator [Oceanispirochaeta crateris]QEN09551.1 LacI family transcriptional regulator [Oceanispirochaeta crateris]